MDKIIESACWAPSGANSQPWEFILVKKPELKDKIIARITGQNSLGHKMEVAGKPEMRIKWTPGGYSRVPVSIILAGDTRTIEAYPLNTVMQKSGSTFITGLARAFLI